VPWRSRAPVFGGLSEAVPASTMCSRSGDLELHRAWSGSVLDAESRQATPRVRRFRPRRSRDPIETMRSHPPHHHVAALGIPTRRRRSWPLHLAARCNALSALLAALLVGCHLGRAEGALTLHFLLAGPWIQGPSAGTSRLLGRVGDASREIEAHGTCVSDGPCPAAHHGAVDQVRSRLGPALPRAVGQAKADRTGIENVAFP